MTWLTYAVTGKINGFRSARFSGTKSHLCISSVTANVVMLIVWVNLNSDMPPTRNISHYYYLASVKMCTRAPLFAAASGPKATNETAGIGATKTSI